VVQPHKPQLDAGRSEQAQLVCIDRLAIDAQQTTDPKPQPRRCQRAVGRSAAKSPATLIVRGQVSRRGTYYHNVKPMARVVG
jgi:hypothetical protein